MNASVVSSSLHWGDRTRLLPKAVGYVFSLDFIATSTGAHLEVKQDERGRIYHVFSQTVVTTPDGATCELPTGNVEWGDVDVGQSCGTSPSWLQARLRVRLDPFDRLKTGSSPSMLFECTGVVGFDGGREALLNTRNKHLSGSAFVSSNHQCSVAAYRWLERRQLFGVGRSEGKRGSSGDWDLEFSFDFYAAV